MKLLKQSIKESDILGIEASLYYKNSNTKVKSIFGGVLSIMIIILILSGGGYFVYLFFNRSTFTLISNAKEDNSINHKNFSDVPFMIRLSGNRSALFPSTYYKIRMRLLTYEEGKETEQTYIDYKMETCDINNSVLSKKKSLFGSVNNINTYLCPDWKGDNHDLYGIYGSTRYRYIQIYVAKCVNDDSTNNPDKTVCLEENKLDEILSVAYVDFITLSFKIDHYSQIPNEEILYKARIPVSNTVFKRIWMSFSQIVYNSDTGYIFEETSKTSFFSVNGYTVDNDLREMNDNIFAWFTIINYDTTTTYTRSYMKAQTLLANIGGIVKGLMMCGFIINYSISNNIYNLRLINSIYDKESICKDSIKDSSPIINNKMINIKQSNMMFIGNNKNEEMQLQYKKNNYINIGDMVGNIDKNDINNNNDGKEISDTNMKKRSKSKEKTKLTNNYINKVYNNNASELCPSFRNNNNNYKDNTNSISNSNKHINMNQNQNINTLESLNRFNSNSKFNPMSNSINNETARKNNHSNSNNFLFKIRSKSQKSQKSINNNDDSKQKSKKIYKTLTSHTKYSNDLKHNTKLNSKILVNNNNNFLINNPLSNTKYLITKKMFTLSKLHMLDPFQYCLSKDKKSHFNERLKTAEDYLSISNLLSIIQEFYLLKKTIFNDNQLSLIENINRYEVNSDNLSEAYNIINTNINNNNLIGGNNGHINNSGNISNTGNININNNSILNSNKFVGKNNKNYNRFLSNYNFCKTMSDNDIDLKLLRTLEL